MVEQMTEDLRALSKFTAVTLDGLTTQVAEGDRETLIKVKEHLANVAEKDRMVNLTIDKSRAILAWLQDKEGAHVRGCLLSATFFLDPDEVFRLVCWLGGWWCRDQHRICAGDVGESKATSAHNQGPHCPHGEDSSVRHTRSNRSI